MINLVSINLFKAPAQIPSGVWSDVAFIYAGFGLAVFESTPNDPVGALRRRLEAVFYYFFRFYLFGKVTYLTWTII